MSYDPFNMGKLSVRAENFEFSRRFLKEYKEHIALKETAGWPLIIFAVIGLLWSNLVFPETYAAVWDKDILVDLGVLSLSGHLKHIVNDLLLPLFFFMIGLEIKHELVHGELSTPKRAAMPLALALGGMLVPALIYIFINPSGLAVRGWAVPVSTDVAFSLAILSLFGAKIPHDLKVLTMAFAVVDDIGGVLVIALFFTESVYMPAFFFATGLYAVMLILLRYRIFGAYIVYTVMGVVFFLAMLKFGVHTTIAGVLLGLAVPSKPVFLRRTFDNKISELSRHFNEAYTKREKLAAEYPDDKQHARKIQEYADREQVILGKIDELVRGTESPCTRLRRTITPFVNYLVLPLFALANAGVVINPEDFAQASNVAPALGIVLGLVLGKPIGVIIFGWIARKLNLAKLPEDVNWKLMGGVAILAGIGFTMSLFIADLAFRGTPILAEAKLAVMAASLLMAVAGGLYFWCILPKTIKVG